MLAVVDHTIADYIKGSHEYHLKEHTHWSNSAFIPGLAEAGQAGAAAGEIEGSQLMPPPATRRWSQQAIIHER